MNDIIEAIINDENVSPDFKKALKKQEEVEEVEEEQYSDCPECEGSGVKTIYPDECPHFSWQCDHCVGGCGAYEQDCEECNGTGEIENY